jgi:hypothetical protein
MRQADPGTGIQVCKMSNSGVSTVQRALLFQSAGVESKLADYSFEENKITGRKEIQGVWYREPIFV